MGAKPPRSARKRMARAQRLVPSVEFLGLERARQQQVDPGVFALIFGLIIVACVVLFATVHALIVPGIIPLLIIHDVLNPRRDVAVTTTGVLVFKESFVNAMPGEVLGTVPLAVLVGAVPIRRPRRFVELRFGNERFRIRTGAWARLVAAVPDAPAGAWAPQPLSPAGPGWHPDPAGRAEHRYWDGWRWTQEVATGGVRAVDLLPTVPLSPTQPGGPGGWVPPAV